MSDASELTSRWQQYHRAAHRQFEPMLVQLGGLEPPTS
jgi:hypothetical protein